MAEASTTWLTYRGAAVRVERSERTIQRWVREGMPSEWDDQGRRIVSEEVLLNELRKRLDAWPPHQYRRRKILGDELGNNWI